MRVDAEADVVHVPPLVAGRRVGRHEIDHAGARAELDEPDRLETPLLAEAEHARVEVERARLVAAADDDVVDLRDPERAVHARAQPMPARASFASSPRVRSTASPSPGTASCAFTRYSLPQWLTLPLRMSGPSTARYSFMWL